MKRPKLDNQKSPKLACPFLKHDPERYRTYKSCTWSGWPTVHRVKEHLFRKHLMPQFTCTRCSQAFASQLQLSNHLRNEILCPITPQTQDGIDADQLRLLRSRKGQGGVSEEEKWVKMYLIIFPDDDAVPSPYHDSSDNVSGESPCPAEPDCKQFEQLRQYLVQEAPGLLQSRLKTLLNGTRQDDVDDGKLKEFAEDFCAELNRNFDVGDTSPRSEKPSTTKATSEQSDYMSGGLTTGNSSGLDLTWPQLDVLSQSYVGTSRTLQPPALANDFGFDFLLGNPDSLLQMDDQSHLQPPGQ
ncbi:hypothetical protein F5B21DRAFT_497622 [Xylaria acuta]|nr:hypothetical protein F5B21DRAFT_497622 [Xylaria acuta]